MRSFIPKTIAIASLIAIVPLAAAQARGAYVNEDKTPTYFHGSHLSAVIQQVDGVRQGIIDARQGNEITAAEARTLEMRVDGVARSAERVAAADHGAIPTGSYDQLLRRLDHANQRLLVDTGSGFNFGNGNENGNYPNG